MLDRDENRSVWEQRLADFESCQDITIKDWCKNNGISDPGFSYWRSKVKKEKMEIDVPAFMPMEVIRETAVTFESSSRYLATLQIGDFLVNIPAAFDETALSKLLKVVKSIC